MNSIDPSEQTRILTTVFDALASKIRAHEPVTAASYFTENAIFQGFDKTRAVGRAAIAAYYDKQPVGLSPAFRVLEQRRLADDVLITYADVDFTRPDGVVIPVHLTAVLQQREGVWLIGHYHVSRIE